MPGIVRVFVGASLDGFIAGPGDDLSWLPQPSAAEDFGFADHMEQTAAILMGRRTYDVVAGHAGDHWLYGDTPVYVATSRPLEPLAPSVRAIAGESAADLLAAVQADIGDGGVYVDGGALIRSLLDEGLVDEIVVTVIPQILGAGVPLFAGTALPHRLELDRSEEFERGLVQLRYTVVD